MKIEPLDNITPEKWDEIIGPYESTMLSHRSAWLNFLAATTHGDILRCKITEDGSTQGYFCAVVQRKWLFNLLGSPLTGWHTDYMGPIVNKKFNQEKFFKALDDIARIMKIDFLQIGSPFFDPGILLKMGYTMGDWKALVIDLHPDTEIMWREVSSKCRNRIRKGRENGLVVEYCRQPDFINEFYSQLKEVFDRKNLPPPFSITFAQNLYRHLMPHNLFALRVKYGNETVGTGLFIHDNHTVSSFGIASRSKYLHLCPNELLNWEAMEYASKLGINKFIIGHSYRISKGVFQFKSKFKCKEQSIYRYSKLYSNIAKFGHYLFKSLYNVRILTRDFLSKKDKWAEHN